MENYFETVRDFVAHINKIRRRGGWYGGTFTVAGKDLRIKSYGTWNQILSVDGIHSGGNMDLSVSAWKQEIVDSLTK